MAWVRYFKDYTDDLHGYVTSAENAKLLLRSYEESTLSKFVTYTRMKDFGKDLPEELLFKHRILISSVQTCGPHPPDDGTPYIVVATSRYDCHQGRNRELKKDAKFKEDVEERNDGKKKRFRIQDTKKQNCPVVVIMRHCVVFTKYQAVRNSLVPKRDAVRWLKRDIKAGVDLGAENRIYVQLADPSTHQGHRTDELGAMSQPIDERIREKIKVLYASGVRSVVEMKRHIENFVEELFVGREMPSIINRRFYPNRKDFQNIMTQCRRSGDYSQLLPESRVNFAYHDEVIDLLNEQAATNKKAKYFYRPAVRGDNEESQQSLLFVQQTEWQQDILQKYGNSISIINKICTISSDDMPLYFLCVKTNVDFCVAASFVVEAELAVQLVEVLDVLKLWNPNWYSHNWMVDNNDVQHAAVQASFPEANVKYCDYSRERDWQDWLQNLNSGVGKNIEKVFRHMRGIAKSTSLTEYNLAVVRMQKCEEWWSNVNLCQWFTTEWLNKSENWAWAFRTGGFPPRLNSKNGMRSIHQLFHNDYFYPCEDKSLRGIIKLLANKFVPDSHMRYRQQNVRCSSTFKTYHKMCPDFLRDRPREMVEHVRQRYEAALNTIPADNVIDHGMGIFSVKCSDSAESYIVQFDVGGMPHCGCLDWNSHQMLCKHFCGVFIHCPGWTWDQLAPDYKNSVYFNLDLGIDDQSESRTVFDDVANEIGDIEFLLSSQDEANEISTVIEKTDNLLNVDILSDVKPNVIATQDLPDEINSLCTISSTPVNGTIDEDLQKIVNSTQELDSSKSCRINKDRKVCKAVVSEETKRKKRSPSSNSSKPVKKRKYTPQKKTRPSTKRVNLKKDVLYYLAEPIELSPQSIKVEESDTPDDIKDFIFQAFSSDKVDKLRRSLQNTCYDLIDVSHKIKDHKSLKTLNDNLKKLYKSIVTGTDGKSDDADIVYQCVMEQHDLSSDAEIVPNAAAKDTQLTVNNKVSNEAIENSMFNDSAAKSSSDSTETSAIENGVFISTVDDANSIYDDNLVSEIYVLNSMPVEEASLTESIQQHELNTENVDNKILDSVKNSHIATTDKKLSTTEVNVIVSQSDLVHSVVDTLPDSTRDSSSIATSTNLMPTVGTSNATLYCITSPEDSINTLVTNIDFIQHPSSDGSTSVYENMNSNKINVSISDLSMS